MEEFQPLEFNGTNFDLNNQNEIATSYTYLPWMFIFDSTFSLEGRLIYESTVFTKRDLLLLKIQVHIFKFQDEGELYIKDPLRIIYNTEIIKLNKKPLYLNTMSPLNKISEGKAMFMN